MRAALLCWLLICAKFSYAEEPTSSPTTQRIIVTPTTITITVIGAMLFDENSDAINPGTASALTLLVQIIKDLAHVKTFEISGHADPATEKRSAQKLAVRRAKAARSYLISQGVDPKRLIAKGYADKKPLKISAAEGSINRRVEISIAEVK